MVNVLYGIGALICAFFLAYVVMVAFSIHWAMGVVAIFAIGAINQQD